jgi:uncharacterized protein DUF6438
MNAVWIWLVGGVAGIARARAIMSKLTILVLVAGRLCASGGELFDYYYKHVRRTTNWAHGLSTPLQQSRFHQILSTNHGISEIGIERIGSPWGGPTYTFIAKNDGTFRYRGEAYVEHLGQFSGTIPVRQFHELAWFIRDSGYMSFEDEYRFEMTDSLTTFTSVVLDGKRKVIRNYANAGPTTLWAIEQLIDKLVAEAKWKLELPKAPGPVLPKVTPYDADPVLQAAYLESFRKGYGDAWERKESLPVIGPTSDSDKARTLGYAEGMVAGRAALDKWFGTNRPPIGPTNAVSLKQ